MIRQEFWQTFFKSFLHSEDEEYKYERESDGLVNKTDDSSSDASCRFLRHPQASPGI